MHHDVENAVVFLRQYGRLFGGCCQSRYKSAKRRWKLSLHFPHLDDASCRRSRLPSTECPLQDYSSHAFNSVKSDFGQVDHVFTRLNVWMEIFSPFARPTMKASANQLRLSSATTSTQCIDLSSHQCYGSLTPANYIALILCTR